MSDPVILWFRRDLRLSDHAALIAAAQEGPVVPVYILDDETPKHRAMGGASRWWLHHSLASLDNALRDKGSRLILRRGRSADALDRLCNEIGTKKVHTIRHYEPWWINAEKNAAKSLDLSFYDGNYLLRPGTLRTGSGGAYKIYTPFMRAMMEYMPPPEPARRPPRIDAPATWPDSERLADWESLPTRPNWATGLAKEWEPGEDGARKRLKRFRDHVADYDEARNLPSQEGSSRLSAHLHFGEISPTAVWHALHGKGRGESTFLRELIWRDYAQNVVFALPDYGKRNGKPQFDAMPWRDHEGEAAADLAAWRAGRTGYPIVDAGMRQLWATGWMHNRVRMIAASFLVKHLLIDWRVGEQWFWDTLVDADYGNNAVNWQWVMGSGIDANMFVRIMAPLTQSEKFDAGGYIRHWVPELADLDDPWVHDPEAHGCRPSAYPPKVIGHREARARALAAWDMIKG
ncbi:MAG: deoxyribodipyrimidine photo-lyase [Sphingobium sp.]